MEIDLWKMFLRLLIACICGAFVGYERSLRHKEAGLRTHIILALGACLAMIVSKYGFTDMSTMKSADGARIAAQVVSGVGFLGAGVIFVRGGSVKGLKANPDNLHFNSESLREFGARYYNEFLRLEDKNKVFTEKCTPDMAIRTEIEKL